MERNEREPKSDFIPLRQAARSLGLPIAYLRREAKADRVPSLRVNRRLFFNLEALRRSLNVGHERTDASLRSLESHLNLRYEAGKHVAIVPPMEPTP